MDAARAAATFEAQADALARVDTILAASKIKSGEFATGITNAALGLKQVAHLTETSGAAMDRVTGAAGGFNAQTVRLQQKLSGAYNLLGSMVTSAQRFAAETEAEAEAARNLQAIFALIPTALGDVVDGISEGKTALAEMIAAQPGDGWLGAAIGRAGLLMSTLWGAAAAAAAAQSAAFDGQFTEPDANGKVVDRSRFDKGNMGRGLPSTVNDPPPFEPAPSSGTGAGAGGGAAPQTDAVQQFLESQQRELDLLRETDPVQKEMIRNRDLLAQATDAQRAAIEAAIRTGIEEQAQIEGTQAAWEAMGNAAAQALEDIILNGKNAGDVIANLGKMLAQATLRAALLGEGPLAGLMGTADGGGVMGALKGIATAAFGGGAAKKAGGGMISGPGTGTSDDIPIWASDGEFMVNARATAQNRGLLEAINSGKRLPAAPRGFAGGGIITGAPPSGAGWSQGAGSSPGKSGDTHYHFNITTPNPKSFAEDRISMARGASRLVAQAGRYS